MTLVRIHRNPLDVNDDLILLAWCYVDKCVG